MKIFKLLLLLTMVCVVNTYGETDKREPHLGYLYPAGGQQGTTFEMTAGGQHLQKADSVYVSGEGVHASVIKYVKPLNKKQLQEVGMKMRELGREQMADMPGKGRRFLQREQEFDRKDANKPDISKEEEIVLPDHPLLKNLDKMSVEELQALRQELFNPKKQQNMQIAETVIIKITIDSKATPGRRELRIGSTAGLTNPVCFEIGTLPEICEPKFNEPKKKSMPSLMLPVVLNGQIMPGEVDRFHFRAHGGQRLVIETHARRLIPYLADAVPGWFQATVSLCDANGNEQAWADDYRFDPDPVLCYEIFRGGEYVLEIRDALYRGREDFVYRITVGERPFISQMFPLGGQADVNTVASIVGWNLPKRQLSLDTQVGADGIREAALHQKKWLSNSMPYAVDTLPECNDIETNDTLQDARQIALAVIINGRIMKSGDVDVFRFDGHGGDEVVAEVYARRLGSPLDSLLRLIDASGKVLSWNDDHEDKEMGLQTHYADSYINARLPKDGVYYVQLSDAQHHGGKEYGYRLRVGVPRPDFTIYVTPSSMSVPAGHTVAFYAHVFRKEGFSGDIEVAIKDAPAGFKLTGSQIPGNCDRIHMTLTAPEESFDDPVVLQLEGCAAIGGKVVSRQAIPAEDMMQAFAYRHLVPSQELLVAVSEVRRFAPLFEPVTEGRVKIPVGGTTQVRVTMWKRPMLKNVQLELSEPPKGITLQDTTVTDDEVVLTLKTDEKLVHAGLKDNLIAEAFTEMARNRQGGKTQNQKQRVSLGVLPAIPFEIVK